MKQILVFNSGSTSLKYKIFSIGKDNALRIVKEGGFKGLREDRGMSHDMAIRSLIRSIGNLTDIAAIGHRVVHGGNEFVAPTKIDQLNLRLLEKYNRLAPLHNPYNLMGIKSCLVYFSNIPNVAVFDTAFFKTLPLKAKIYPIPFEYYQKFGIERFGFHGISHQYLVDVAASKLKKSVAKLNLITCHLGGGCSVAAIKNGLPIDISMGYTPLEGLVMKTRSGDLDPGVILEIQEILLKNNPKNKESEHLLLETNNILNKESGIKGLFGSDHYLKLLKVKDINPRAKLAFDIFVYRLQKYISAYWGILDKVDAIVFSGGIGSGKPATRRAVIKDLRFLKKTKILTIKTDEELAIAKECLKFIINK
jgi:acetate kinase